MRFIAAALSMMTVTNIKHCSAGSGAQDQQALWRIRPRTMGNVEANR